jgi:hypothetical protein
MISPSTQSATPMGPTVANAFLLGWAIAEALGHSRHGTRSSKMSPGRPMDAKRLTVSDSEDHKDSFVHLFILERMVQLHHCFKFEAEDHISPLTAQVYSLPAKLAAWQLDSTQPFYTAQDLYALLEPWSAQVGAALNALSAARLRAFVAGMSLADTYWSWQLRGRQTDKEIQQSIWRSLLSSSRLEEICHRLQTIKSQLPPYVAEVISRNLRGWTIGNYLVYTGNTLAKSKNRASRFQLQPDHEVALQKALKEQIRYWRRMLFGSWEPETFLSPSKRRQIRHASIAVFIVLVLLAVSVYGMAGALIASLVSV